MMNQLLCQLQFGKSRFRSFRKRLPLDFKMGDRHSHKNPHGMPLVLKQKLLNVVKGGDWKKIRQIERQSLTPYGKFTKFGFKFDKDKLPFYDIPNLDGFELKPYVEYLAPLLTEDLKDYQKVVNENKLKQMSSTSQSSQSKPHKLDRETK